jgi:two-component system sensor histidine kinase FlrB
MNSLPISGGWSNPLSEGAIVPADLAQRDGNGNSNRDGNRDGNREDEQSLLHAFRSFAGAAASLERSYAALRGEVERLRRELEASNSDLARSVEENRGMRQHLDQILESLPCGVLVVGGDGQISKANLEAERLAETLRGSLRRIDDLPGTLHQLLLRSREDRSEREISFPDSRGSARWIAARHAAIGENDSVYILSDVSERKRLEEAQASLRREQALAEISAVLAHEIRNPLGSLELFAGLLAESELNSDCREWLGHLQAGLRTLAATVNNVLHFHSLPPPERSEVDLGALLEWGRDFFAPLASQSKVVLGLQNRVSGLLLAADRHRLEQVLLNLVLNSVRAMPGGGWIELAGHRVRGGNAVAIAVRDTGPGISQENLERIFEPGFSTRSGSPGLGLAVCRKIIEQHGGTLEVSSRAGCGASFTMIFPLSSSGPGVVA